MFTNYSQTYAAGITALVGLIVAIFAAFKVSVIPDDIQFIVGLLVNLGGVVWTLWHRLSKGDIKVSGSRK